MDKTKDIIIEKRFIQLGQLRINMDRIVSYIHMETEKIISFYESINGEKYDIIFDSDDELKRVLRILDKEFVRRVITF